MSRTTGRVLDICMHQPVREIPSLLRCATADANAGRAPDAIEADSRQAWLSGITDPPGELAFLRQWGKGLTAADQWRRFDKLAWTDNGSVGGPAWRQIARLDPSQRPAAEARLALKRDDSSARALVAALPGGAHGRSGADAGACQVAAPGNGQDDDAQKLWLAMGSAAEHAAARRNIARPSGTSGTCWRAAVLRNNDNAGAYALVDGATELAPEQAIDAEFLAGFIALRRLTRHGCGVPPFPHARRVEPRRHHAGPRLLLARPHGGGPA